MTQKLLSDEQLTTIVDRIDKLIYMGSFDDSSVEEEIKFFFPEIKYCWQMKLQVLNVLFPITLPVLNTKKITISKSKKIKTKITVCE